VIRIARFLVISHAITITDRTPIVQPV